MRRTDKRSSSKYIFLGVLFIATMVVTFLSMGLETVTPSATTMTEATLPVISMLTDEGTEFNPLHGYTAAINQALTNDSLTPIAQNRKLDIVIYSYGADVQEVSYKVRSLSDNSLIENTKVNTLNRDDNKITATLGIKNLIDDNVQYALEIMIKTSAHDEIYYYTRIVTGENYELDKKFEFVKYFNACTLNPGRLNEIQKYLETLSSGNNSNYGKVNINSSLSQVGWGEITPYIESQLVPKVKEISKDVAIITLNYRAGAVNEYDSYDSYNVYEYYRIRQTNSGFYLLNYEREANQIFDGKNDLTSAGKINLGIQSSSTAEYASDEKARYAYYVNEGSLWCFNTDDNIYTRPVSDSCLRFLCIVRKVKRRFRRRTSSRRLLRIQSRQIRLPVSCACNSRQFQILYGRSASHPLLHRRRPHGLNVTSASRCSRIPFAVKGNVNVEKDSEMLTTSKKKSGC